MILKSLVSLLCQQRRKGIDMLKKRVKATYDNICNAWDDILCEWPDKASDILDAKPPNYMLKIFRLYRLYIRSFIIVFITCPLILPFLLFYVIITPDMPMTNYKCGIISLVASFLGGWLVFKMLCTLSGNLLDWKCFLYMANRDWSIIPFLRNICNPFGSTFDWCVLAILSCIVFIFFIEFILNHFNNN